MNKNNIEGNDPKEFATLSQDKRIQLTAWITNNIAPIQGFNERHSSYGMKHLFEGSIDGFYITNGQFKGAMLELGFKAQDKTAVNWIFNVSQKSKCFKSKTRLA